MTMTDELDFGYVKLSEVASVKRIDAECFAQPYANWWREMAGHNRRRKVLVCRKGGRVVGVADYRVTPTTKQLIKIGVTLSERRLGIGKAMVERLHGTLTSHHTHLTAAVNENNSMGQRFLVACGLRLVHVQSKYYADGSDMMVYSIAKE
jgi:ribosomal protein S18 acetylase RimI-like enzyme